MSDWIEDAPIGEAAERAARKCCVCGEAMSSERRRGVLVDVCKEHGLWLDKGELEKILLSFGGDMRRASRRRSRRIREEAKVEGALLGWWSLLLD
jgi:Zn-finger nucleic acid-binding protein